jgi:hypothetical protein
VGTNGATGSPHNETCEGRVCTPYYGNGGNAQVAMGSLRPFLRGGMDVPPELFARINGVGVDIILSAAAYLVCLFADQSGAEGQCRRQFEPSVN